MSDDATRPARASRTTPLPRLLPAPAGWQRAAEVAGFVAAGMLAAAGVIPW